MARSHRGHGRIAVLGDRDMSRGFTDTQRNTGSVLGERFFSMILKQQKQKNSKTENATEWFRRPAYYFGERRHKDGQNQSRI